MGENSRIEWTHNTFNPWLGCTRVSPGCQHCYAETMMDKRYGKVEWGPQGKRVRTSDAYWQQPDRWDRAAEAEGVRRRVFCGSLCDVFEDKRDQALDMSVWRGRLWHLIEQTPQLDWLLLTKRPENVLPFVPWRWTKEYAGRFPPNVWIGTSVENQEGADKRIPELLEIPAAVRFLSVEPLLGPVTLGDDFASWLTCNVTRTEDDDIECCESYAVGGTHYRGIDWVIVGGESGPNARPLHPNWATSIRDQCVAAGVPFHFKQWGEYGASAEDMTTGLPAFRFFKSEQQWVNKARTWVGKGDVCVDMTGKVLRNGADFAQAAYPVAVMRRLGKKRAGRLLDGEGWNEFPVVDRDGGNQ